MTQNDHFEAQKCHFWAFWAFFQISFSSLQHPKHDAIYWLAKIICITQIAHPRYRYIFFRIWPLLFYYFTFWFSGHFNKLKRPFDFHRFDTFNWNDIKKNAIKFWKLIPISNADINGTIANVTTGRYEHMTRFSVSYFFHCLKSTVSGPVITHHIYSVVFGDDEAVSFSTKAVALGA